MALFGEPGRGDRIARRLAFPLLLLFALVVTLVWVVHFPLRVAGDSMFPSLHDGDRVLVTRGYPDPRRGDVIVVSVTRRGATEPVDMLKRVVALAGESVRIEQGIAFVDGVPERPSARVLLSPDDVSRREISVPEGHLYVLGDNRPASLDSRFYGPVPITEVRGRVTFVFAPATRFGTVD